MTGVDNLFLQIGLVISVAAAAAFIFRLLKQPQILAYVIVGVLITPVFGLVTDTSIVESMSAVGVAFLLFIVGLEMNIKSLRDVALVTSVGGMIQVSLLFVIGYLIALFLGFLTIEASYIGLMLAFSSTMVVMKLLSDKKELATLHGKLAIGILLMQDIIAIFALLILGSLDGFSWTVFGITLLKFIGMFVLAYILSKYLFPQVFKFAARNQELLLMTSLAVCFMFSLAFHYLDFSIAIGAFIAGVALGNLSYSVEIAGKIKSLKDFFALLFFVSLGMGISIAVIQEMWLEALILLFIIMIIKPIVIFTTCLLFKYTKKPSFMTANALAQVGEFSLILLAQGLALGHVSQELFSLGVFVTLMSITLTSYYIEYNQFFYKLMQGPLKIFDRFTTEGLEYKASEVKPKIVLCGHNRIGYSVLRDLKSVKKEVLVVDYNPEVIDRMVDEGYHCIYGEVRGEEIIERMNLKGLKIMISTVPDHSDSVYLIRKVREVNKRAMIMVTANDVDDALDYYDKGADYVILPHFLGGEHVSHMLGKIRKKKINLKDEKKIHIKHLHQRREIGHKHPKEM